MVSRKNTLVSKLSVVHEQEWGDFTYGAPVKVLSNRVRTATGKMKAGLSFTFCAYVHNTETGARWVDVLEHKYGKDPVVRAYAIDEIELIKPKRKYKRRK